MGSARTNAPLDLEQFNGASPGPWKRLADYSPEAGGPDQWSPYILDVTGGNVAAAMMQPRHEATFVANARLIAAGPALLAECKRLTKENDELRAEILAARR